MDNALKMEKALPALLTFWGKPESVSHPRFINL